MRKEFQLGPSGNPFGLLTQFTPKSGKGFYIYAQRFTKHGKKVAGLLSFKNEAAMKTKTSEILGLVKKGGYFFISPESQSALKAYRSAKAEKAPAASKSAAAKAKKPGIVF